MAGTAIFCLVVVSMWIFNFSYGLNNVSNMNVFSVSQSPPIVGSLMYGYVFIGAIMCGNSYFSLALLL